jgi:osmoprotectant transport system substrate-binding protein
VIREGRRAKGVAVRLGLIMLLGLVPVACGHEDRPTVTSSALDDDAVTIGSFNFAESALLSELYAQALEGQGYEVERAGQVGPREIVAPALVRGLLELVPEYAGTALTFLSLGDAQPTADQETTHEALSRSAAERGLVALAPSPAQDANAFVVTRATAERLGIERLSDLAPLAGDLTFGGPPECASRPLCLEGLRDLYGIEFKTVLALDPAGPRTREALQDGAIDVALMFTTTATIDSDDLVVLTDDRRLQPAENVTPLLRQDVVDRWGQDLVDTLDAVSERLSTDDLRRLNTMLDGRTPADVAAEWLQQQGLA